jgi:hypothetical protein
MIQQARVRHVLAQRTRISVDAMRHRRAYFAWLRDELTGLPGVQSVRTNPGSASVVLQHAHGALAAIAAQARERELFELEAPESDTAVALRRTEAGLALLDGALKRAAQGGLSPAALLYAGLAATAVVQISRGQILAPVATLAWSAFELWGRARTATQQMQ